MVRLYPYDISEDDGEGVEEKSLRGSSQEIADILKEEIQKKVEIAGLEISEARIPHLAYAPEIEMCIRDSTHRTVEAADGMAHIKILFFFDELLWRKKLLLFYRNMGTM